MRNVTRDAIRRLLKCYGWVQKPSSSSGHEHWEHPCCGIKVGFKAHGPAVQSPNVVASVVRALEATGVSRAEVREWFARCGR